MYPPTLTYMHVCIYGCGMYTDVCTYTHIYMSYVYVYMYIYVYIYVH